MGVEGLWPGPDPRHHWIPVLAQHMHTAALRGMFTALLYLFLRRSRSPHTVPLPALLNSLGAENRLDQGHLLSAGHLSACQAQPLAALPPSAASRLLSWVLAQITRLGAPKSLWTLLHILLPSEPGVTSFCPPSLPQGCPQLPLPILCPSAHPPRPFSLVSLLFFSLLPGPLQVLALSARGSCLQLDPHWYISKTRLRSASGPL